MVEEERSNGPYTMSDDGAPDPASETADYDDDPAYAPWGQSQSGALKRFIRANGLMLAVIAFGIVIVIYLLTLLNADNPQQAPPAQTAQLQMRMDQLEQRITDLETFGDSLKGLDAKLEVISRLEGRVEKLEATLKTWMEQTAEQLSEISEKPASTAAATVKKSSTAQKKKSARYHTVKRGDTLYGISQRYGLSLNELLRRNNLSKNAKIVPGQKLKISS